jgi:hypothetical protein
MRLRLKKTVRENAARLLPALAREFFSAGDRIAGAAGEHARLHAFCNLTRRFSYSLECFRCCYGASLDKYWTAMQGLLEIQEKLENCASSRAIYQSAGLRRGKKKLLDALDRRRQGLRERLLSGWEPFESPVMRRKFLRYLEHPARPRKSARLT